MRSPRLTEKGLWGNFLPYVSRYNLSFLELEREKGNATARRVHAPPPPLSVLVKPVNSTN